MGRLDVGDGMLAAGVVGVVGGVWLLHGHWAWVVGGVLLIGLSVLREFRRPRA